MKFNVINSFTVVGFSIVLLLLLSFAALQRSAEVNSTRIAGMTCKSSLACPIHPAQVRNIGALLK